MRGPIARIVLVWIIAAAATMAWWSLRGSPGRAERVGITRPLATSLPIDRVQELVITRPDGRLHRFADDGAGWRQVEPFDVGLDAYGVRQFGTAAQALTRVDSMPLDDPETAARLGLDPPVATITWRWPEGEETVELGNRTLAGRAWVRFTDEPGRAALVDAGLHEKVIETDYRFLRDRTLAPEAGSETVEILIKAGEERMELGRTDSGWELLRPVKTRGDEAAIMDWLARVARTRASGYLHDQPDRLDRFGLEDPIGVVELRARRGGDPRIVLLGDPIGVGSADRYAMVTGSPTVLRVDEETQQALVPAAASLIDGTGTGVVREDIALVEIRTDTENLSLQREFDGWVGYLDEEEPTAVDREPVENLLGLLTSTPSTEIVLARFPADMQHAIVILYGFDGSPLDTVRIAREPQSGSWALENGDDVLRVYPASFGLELDSSDYGLTPGG
ncbi:MAG: DUF4340 domain-containing protein [Phycisphaerales bacterium]|nr:DUF4340 domain-containing protein [Phycisphaerales bacterium]